MNKLVIGDEERVIDRVDTYLEGGGEAGSVAEILHNSRAFKLSDKIHDRVVTQKIMSIATGAAMYSSVPHTARQVIPIPSKSRNPSDRARKIEKAAAVYSAALFAEI
jgi:hypothetical protein